MEVEPIMEVDTHLLFFVHPSFKRSITTEITIVLASNGFIKDDGGHQKTFPFFWKPRSFTGFYKDVSEIIENS